MNSPHLDEVLGHLRSGDAGAEQELQRIFAPGVRFLLRQRLGRREVESEARAVLKTAIRLIHADHSVRGDALARLVRNCIQQRFPSEARPKGPAIAASSGTAAEAAAGVLVHMSEVEREALRDYYLHGKDPDTFMKRLHLTRREFREIRMRARAAFSATQKENVA